MTRKKIVLIMEGYKESWAFIRQACHSLERYTNLGLCFSDIHEERIKLRNQKNTSQISAI